MSREHLMFLPLHRGDVWAIIVDREKRAKRARVYIGCRNGEPSRVWYASDKRLHFLAGYEGYLPPDDALAVLYSCLSRDRARQLKALLRAVEA